MAPCGCTRVQLEKQMTVLENRVDKAIQRLCGRQAETGRLRDSIDGLRKERLSLNEALAKLEAALAAQRAEAARLLRISQANCVGRDKVALPSSVNCYICCICQLSCGQLICLLPHTQSMLAMRLLQALEISRSHTTLLLLLRVPTCKLLDDDQVFAAMNSRCGMIDAGFGEHSRHKAGRRQGGGQR